jgi:Putative protein-S-isoprenylcysteine methyltransferase
MLKRFVPLSFSFLVTATCLFAAAGSFFWPNAWLLLGINFAAGLAAMVLLWRSPDLLAERSNTKAGKNWDKPIVMFVVLLGPAATWITAGLDTRFHWTKSMGVPSTAFGAVAAIFAAAFIAWAMRTNRFFSSVIRIQKDRGHVVVSDGPYRIVRHPGYTGMAMFTFVTPLILDSRRAFIPAIITVAMWVLRTALEDRTLRNELEGYSEYARCVKYRLVPYIW